MNWIVNEIDIDDIQFSARDKPRCDINHFLVDEGFSSIDIKFVEDREKASIFKKAFNHFLVKNNWLNVLKHLKKDDNIVIQFPVKNHTFLFSSVINNLKSKGVNVIGVIHDLEIIRNSKHADNFVQKIRIEFEEIKSLKEFDKLIVHNEKMKNFISERLDIDANRMISLDIFDYLVDGDNKNTNVDDSVVIAGNFKGIKASYIYNLPKNVNFNLYGINFDENYQSNNINYCGSFHPDKIANTLKGKYGLVWDGNSTSTCSGSHGEYLRYNNPHKTSLYLASGLPVIIWDNAAIAKFIIDNNCGICIDNLDNLSSVIAKVDDNKYQEMLDNVNRVSKLIKSGHYIKKAIKKCLG